MWSGFQRPQKVEVDRDAVQPNYGRFVAQPFERGVIDPQISES